MKGVPDMNAATSLTAGLLALCCVIGGHDRAAETPVFACSFGEKSVTITATTDALRFEFGQVGQPEIVLERPLDSSDLAHLYDLFPHSSTEWVRFRDGAFSYVVFAAYDTPESGGYDFSGLMVLEGAEKLAQFECPDAEQFGTTFDLSVLRDDTDDISDLFLPAFPDTDLADDNIEEFGVLVGYEDAVYPLFVVTLEFPERQFQQDFTMDVEALAVDIGKLDGLIGQYISISYVSFLEPNLIDIALDGTMLLGTPVEDIDPEWLTVTGVLSGAAETTYSDLPDEMEVTAADGEQTIFPYYIPEELLPANGRAVTAYYVLTPRTVITRFDPTDQ